MRRESDAVRPELAHIGRERCNVNSDRASGKEPLEAADAGKKPYRAPSFEFERVFEVAALACGKVFSSQSGCRSSRKSS